MQEQEIVIKLKIINMIFAINAMTMVKQPPASLTKLNSAFISWVSLLVLKLWKKIGIFQAEKFGKRFFLHVGIKIFFHS